MNGFTSHPVRAARTSRAAASLRTLPGVRNGKYAHDVHHADRIDVARTHPARDTFLERAVECRPRVRSNNRLGTSQVSRNLQPYSDIPRAEL
jgi:hypothetical protein